MKILGFNFTKIHAEKLPGEIKGVKVETDIDIIDIKEAKSDFFNKKEKILGVKFKNNIIYDPNFARIELEGSILVSLDKNDSDKILKDWEDKNLEEDFRLKMFNLIIKKSSLKALHLEEEINIPLHIPMPVLRPQSPAEMTKKE